MVVHLELTAAPLLDQRGHEVTGFAPPLSGPQQGENLVGSGPRGV
jgi:hypothetical protein